MKRSEMLKTRLSGPVDAIQMCRDLIEGNFNARDIADIDHIELQARIYTDFEILAQNQFVPEAAMETMFNAGMSGILSKAQLDAILDALEKVDAR